MALWGIVRALLPRVTTYGRTRDCAGRAQSGRCVCARRVRCCCGLRSLVPAPAPSRPKILLAWRKAHEIVRERVMTESEKRKEWAPTVGPGAGSSGPRRRIEGRARAQLAMLLVLATACGGADDEALRHLLSGNELAGQGRHLEAIEAWREAAQLRPDSSVPLNNMANSYLGLERVDDALNAAEEAFRRKVDYMTSVTLSNVHKKKKQFREAEEVLLRGAAATQRSSDPHEHAFWSLASLYWDQGDYSLFLHYAQLGLQHKSSSSCSPLSDPSCAVPAFEVDILNKMCEATVELGKHAAAARDTATALAMRQAAHNISLVHAACSLPAEFTDVCIHDCVRSCLSGSARFSCSHAPVDARRGSEETCSDDECARLLFASTRYSRMAPVRIMGCDWRHRALDQLRVQESLERGAAWLLEERAAGEWLFECQGGLVCGCGPQVPLHVWASNLSLPSVAVMGQVQAQGLLRKMAAHDPPPMVHHSYLHVWQLWGKSSGRARLHVAFISSDLLRDHPVGNMMRSVLPLHDLSRMQVTVYLIHEQQRHAAEQREIKHLLGDVALVYMGRGPNVTQMYDSFESQRAANLVNSAGVCILIDLIGYTSDHRQDVLALRPAPLQMHYHGYMGSTGATYMDYYMGDRVIVPPEHARHSFTETLVLLPESFLGPSHRLTHQLWGGSGGSRIDFEGLGEDHVSVRRLANGLPPSGPVICNFNQHFKIDPDTFGIWRRAVGQVNATLWLLRGTPVSERNLLHEFQAPLAREGDRPPALGRLLWAERVPVKDHLRRAALCDLALDTWHYNMGATGADTLYASVPVLHRPSTHAVGRMMASLLRALRMEELIVPDALEMLTLAAALTAPAGVGKLAALRIKLVRRILWAPLFDVRGWVNDLDTSLRLMWDEYLARPPAVQGEAGGSRGGAARRFNVVTARPTAVY